MARTTWDEQSAIDSYRDEHRDSEREPYRTSPRLTDDDYRERMLLLAGSAFVCDYDEDRGAQDDRIAARNERADEERE